MNKFLIFFLFFTSLYAKTETPKPLQELWVEASSEVAIGDTSLDYRTVAGTLVLKDPQGKDRATMFYVAYFKKGDGASSERPLTFCCNGGPGAGSQDEVSSTGHQDHFYIGLYRKFYFERNRHLYGRILHSKALHARRHYL